tara:strand:+ start:461 stop:841 length:381 start_codon:yes stop_codon:yes gene_type:complete
LEIFQKFLKFSIVGFSGLIIDFLVTYLLKEKLKQNKYISHSIGFIAAVINNFYLNKSWTFENHSQEYMTQGLQFLVIALIGLFLSNQIIFILNNKNNINFYISKLMAIGIVVIWNFLANFLITFSH